MALSTFNIRVAVISQGWQSLTVMAGGTTRGGQHSIWKKVLGTAMSA